MGAAGTRFVLAIFVCLLCRSNFSAPLQNTGGPAQTPPFKFEAKVREVLVPVLFLDAAGHAIGNLGRQNFQIFDKGKRQTISGFTVQTSTVPIAANARVPALHEHGLPASEMSPSPEDTTSRRYIAFLFDDLHVDRGDLVQVRKAATRMLASSLKSSDVAAILSTSGRVNTGFTRDQAKLQEAIASLRDAKSFTHPRNDCPDIDHYEAYMIIYQHDPEALDVVANGGERCPRPTPDKQMNEGIARAAAAWELPNGEQQTRATLDVLREVARQMGNLPGQRVLILISPGFIALTPEAGQAKSRVIDMAAQSNVTVSSLDTRGLDTEMEDESKLLPDPALDRFVWHSRIAHGDVMAQLAAGTGGTYFQNSNDYEGGLRNLIIPPEYRYLLQFPPKDSKQDGTFHRIKVKVNKRGVKVIARRGYFAENAPKMDN